MIKVGIIGFGGIADVHYRAYKNIEDAQVVAVADVRYDMAKEKLGDDINKINVYKSMEELLVNENVDMLDICTPTYLHADMTVKTLESGVHVMCEKPMAINSEEAKKMFDAEKNQIRF